MRSEPIPSYFTGDDIDRFVINQMAVSTGLAYAFAANKAFNAGNQAQHEALVDFAGTSIGRHGCCTESPLVSMCSIAKISDDLYDVN